MTTYFSLHADLLVSIAPVLREEIHNLLGKGVVEIVPDKKCKTGFYGRYFLVAKKDSCLYPRPASSQSCSCKTLLKNGHVKMDTIACSTRGLVYFRGSE